MKQVPFSRHPVLLAFCLAVSAAASLPAVAQDTPAKAAERPAATAPSPSQAVTITRPAPEPSAPADATTMAPIEEEPPLEFEPPPLRVGDATQDLLEWQRSGVIASETPRPIPGAIAYRSYERYLKSFEHPIPEYLNSSVKKSTDGGK